MQTMPLPFPTRIPAGERRRTCTTLLPSIRRGREAIREEEEEAEASSCQSVVAGFGGEALSGRLKRRIGGGSPRVAFLAFSRTRRPWAIRRSSPCRAHRSCAWSSPPHRWRPPHHRLQWFLSARHPSPLRVRGSQVVMDRRALEQRGHGDRAAERSRGGGERVEARHRGAGGKRDE